ncbi:hypothetical protein ES703_98895 [subsurface metagenome]
MGNILIPGLNVLVDEIEILLGLQGTIRLFESLQINTTPAFAPFSKSSLNALSNSFIFSRTEYISNAV